MHNTGRRLLHGPACEQGGVRGDAGQLMDQPAECLVYDRRVPVLSSAVKRKTSLCWEQLQSWPPVNYLCHSHFKFCITIGIFSCLRVFFFLNNKSLSPLYRFDVYNIVIYFSFCCFIRRKKKNSMKCPGSVLQPPVTYRKK